MPRSKTVGLTLKQRDERRAEVARRLRDGEPAADVAKALGLAVNSVYAIGAKAREQGLRSSKGTPRSGRPRKIGGWQKGVSSADHAQGRGRERLLPQTQIRYSCDREVAAEVAHPR